MKLPIATKADSSRIHHWKAEPERPLQQHQRTRENSSMQWDCINTLLAADAAVLSSKQEHAKYPMSALLSKSLCLR
jgi:hypothetical protein